MVSNTHFQRTFLIMCPVDLTIATTRSLVRLRRDDLVRLCECRDLDVEGTKPQLAEALLQWRDRHGLKHHLLHRRELSVPLLLRVKAVAVGAARARVSVHLSSSVRMCT